ncbi:MAG: FmdB family zinc ribbon protein [Burkholderiales bacterium]
MPIYAYRCTTCGHAKDVLQKMSDPLLSVCPACGASTFAKQVTAAGFQLKGSGWYVTDFRGDSSGKPAEGAKPDTATKTEGAKTESAAPAAKGDAAPAPAAAAAPAPASPAPSTK